MIEATPLLSASVSPTSCSPIKIWMLGAYLSLVQCAAVSTCLVLMMLPPHHGVHSPVVTRPTWWQMQNLNVIKDCVYHPWIFICLCLNPTNDPRSSLGYATLVQFAWTLGSFWFFLTNKFFSERTCSITQEPIRMALEDATFCWGPWWVMNVMIFYTFLFLCSKKCVH